MPLIDETISPFEAISRLLANTVYVMCTDRNHPPTHPGQLPRHVAISEPFCGYSSVKVPRDCEFLLIIVSVIVRL